MEPGFVCQTVQDPSEHASWCRERKTEAQKEGYTYFRFSTYPGDERMVLVEGWKQHTNHQGSPRWSFAAA